MPLLVTVYPFLFIVYLLTIWDSLGTPRKVLANLGRV
jgi:hypothetical protein